MAYGSGYMENDMHSEVIISKTPIRITFTGGGTDLPQYYQKYGTGACVSATINKYIYIVISNHFYKNELRLSYSKTENSIKDINDIKHNIMRESLRLLGIKGGLQALSLTEIPATGTGLGSSSSFTVGFLNAIHAWKGQNALPEQLAKEAIKVEREMMNEAGGKQDQYIAAYGGVNLMEFKKDESVTVKPIKFNQDNLKHFQDHLLLFYIGSPRSSSKLHQEQVKHIVDKVDSYNRLRELAYETYESMSKGKFDQVGEQMHENWMLKRQLSGSITNPAIDKLYEKERKAGAIGGKVMGAGGGGFMLLLSKPEDRDNIERSMEKLSNQAFSIDMKGSRILKISDE